MARISISLVSESRMSEKRFLKLSDAEQRQYLERYPFSKHKRLLKKPKDDSDREEPEEQDELDEQESEDQESEDSNTEDSEQESEEGDDSKEPESEPEPDADFESEIDNEVKKNLPVVRNSIDESFEKASQNISKIADATRESLSDRDRKNVKEGFESVYSGGPLLSHQSKAMLKAVAGPLFKIAIGAAALAALGAAAGPIGMLVGASYVKSLTSFKLPDKGTSYFEQKRKEAKDRAEAAKAEMEAIKAERELERMRSQSAAFNDPARMLSEDFIRWFGKVDHKQFAEKITELAVLKNRPLESNSSIGVRITCAACPTVKHLEASKRNRFLVRARGEQIGYIEADPKVSDFSANTRCWLVTLEDGFIESNYHTGKSGDQPFTAVRGDSVILRNPYRFTFNEAKNWIRTTVKRELL